MKFKRQSGVVLHPSSLPGLYGIGEIGREAFRFADTLRVMGQSVWQVLPLGPTSFGDSPYQSLSTFAGNHLLISFDQLLEDGLLFRREVIDFPRFSQTHVEFGEIIPERMKVLGIVCEKFDMRAKAPMKAAFAAFQEDNADWLEDYALFKALKFDSGGKSWHEWEPDLVKREPAVLKAAHERLADSVRNVKIMQFLFFHQWKRLHEYCKKIGLKIIGDVPIFVAHDSADAWSHPELYFLDEDRNPTCVAGVPPDYFSATGQLWGNPLYNWEVMEENKFCWWKRRLKKTLELVDIVRIDHFRGFESYWEIPAGEKTAIKGKWVPGPREKLFEAIAEDLGPLPVLAEDLGIITEEVTALREKVDFPGMRVLQFIIGNDENEPSYMPDAFPVDSVCYTGTHDNDTTVGWFKSGRSDGKPKTEKEIKAEQTKILKQLDAEDDKEINWSMIKKAMGTNSSIVIMPLQDILGLGTEGRLNTPGKPQGNWRWRFVWDDIFPWMKQRLRKLTEEAKRVPKP